MENTTGSKAMVAMQSLEKEIVFKKPLGVPKRKSKVKVLEEEAYVEQIGKIIERDFFPDLEKLKAQTEYLEAVERNDMSKLRELYAKYSGNKPPLERIPSPATFETPANIHNSQHTSEHTSKDSVDVSQNVTKSEPKLSLDQYLNTHTSQDNESFEEILKATAIKHRQKYSYLYNEEDKSEEDKQKQLALSSVEEQAALPEKQLNVDTWGYKNRNYIMYIPDGVELTREQQIEMNKKRQEIAHQNTRLSQNPFNELQSKEAISEMAKSQAKGLDGKIGVDGKEIVRGDTPKIGGFSFVRTPAPSPSTMGSPLMTWGEIEGTPFRLDGSDTPLPRVQTPSFKIAEPPRREQIALALAEKVGEKNRNQKKKAMEVAKKHFSSPSPRPSTERLATLSPAARRLATSKLGISSALSPKIPFTPSSTFRIPNSPYSPSQPTKTPKTPKRISTPKLVLGIKKPADNLTDDLLKINLPKRCKAADFF